VSESVWTYPRPPGLDRCTRRVRVYAGDRLVADSSNAMRVLETSHPPTIYVPPADADETLLVPSTRRGTVCEWKGRAVYWDVAGRIAAAWSYPAPVPAYATLRDHLCFYPSRLRCLLDDEPVLAQQGDFYGGWITAELTGPFKGGPGTLGW
jgi:uncharacterized protein (DUF427 family)